MSDDWSPGEERQLRYREVSSHLRATKAQVFGTLVALMASIAAVFASCQAANSVSVSRETIARQVDEGRLSLALDLVGDERPASRVAGLALLRRTVEERVNRALDGNSPADLKDAENVYGSALDLFENYLRIELQSEPTGSVIAGREIPQVPVEHVYAANELRKMLQLAPKLEHTPALDLSKVVLYSQPWQGIDFSTVIQHSENLDLRGAGLVGSTWGESYLHGSFLQCADLTSATFGGENKAGLSSVDLRGANLTNATLKADLTNARLDGANLDGADFTGAILNGVDFGKTVNFNKAKGFDKSQEGFVPPSPTPVLREHIDREECLKLQEYWSDAEMVTP